MADTLRDQLMQLGFKPAPRPERKPGDAGRGVGQGAGGKGQPHSRGAKGGRDERKGHGPARDPKAGDGRPRDGKPRDGKPRQGQAGKGQSGKRPPRSQEEIDLARAYALRAETEKRERIEAERQRQEEARLRREAKAKLATFLDGKALNDANAEIARHFEYGGKIKRIYVTAEQLRALNAGELGVLQQQGRYLLVTAAVLAEAEAIFADAVALRVDPDAPAGEDPYADPAYQVPDDLVW